MGRVLVLLFFLSAFLTSAAPRLTWLFLLLLVVTSIFLYMRGGGGSSELARGSIALVASLLVALFALLSTSWAADADQAIGKAGVLLGILVAVFASSRAIAKLEEAQLRRAACAFAAGTFAGAVFVLIELLTDGAITRATKNSFIILKPTGTKGLVFSDDGLVSKIHVSAFRQNIGILVLNMWPALLAIWVVGIGKYRPFLITALVILIAVSVMLSERESSQLALIVAMLVLASAWVSRRAVCRVLAILWCLAFVVVLPASFAAYNAQLHMAEWLPVSGRARIIIWDYTAERVLERPLFGIGAASTRALRPDPATAERPPGFVFSRTTGPHPHNLFLQVWYELGAVGAVLFAFAGATVALRIQRLPLHAQPFAAASFAAAATMCSLAWEFWQTWLLCGVSLLVLYLFAAAYAKRSPDIPDEAAQNRLPHR